MRLYLKMFAVFAFFYMLINFLFVVPICGIDTSSIIKIYLYYISLIVLIDFLISFFVRIIPKSFYGNNNLLFKERKFEKKFYNKIAIKKWKDKVPEFGKFSGFSKAKLLKPNNTEYLKKFISETKYAELLHWIELFIGVILIFLSPTEFIVSFAILFPIALLHAMMHFLPICIQRYVRPKLIKLLERNYAINAKEEDVFAYEKSEDFYDSIDTSDEDSFIEVHHNK